MWGKALTESGLDYDTAYGLLEWHDPRKKTAHVGLASDVIVGVWQTHSKEVSLPACLPACLSVIFCICPQRSIN